MQALSTACPVLSADPRRSAPLFISGGYYDRDSAPPKPKREMRKPLSKIVVDNRTGSADIIAIAKALYKGLDTPVSRYLFNRVTEGDLEAVAKCRVDPAGYADPHAFFLDYCASEFLRKYPGLGFKTAKQRRDAARDLFFQSEAACAASNSKFAALTDSPDCTLGDHTPDSWVLPILERARVLIKECLKGLPDWRELEYRFGPGSTSANRGEFVSLYDKIATRPECTLHAVPAVSRLGLVSPHLLRMVAELNPECLREYRYVAVDGEPVRVEGLLAPYVVMGNRFVTVNKTAEVDRGICVEPSGNIPFQLALGACISERTAQAFGIVKELQQQVNRGFARHASMGALASCFTMDLSSASDTMAFELVRYLLPRRWFVALASFRSEHTKIDGKWVPLEKFCSMGNGFCFELETLIFYALTRACCDLLGHSKSPVCVYGDDIIGPAELFHHVKRVLEFCGFQVNAKKSFNRQNFAESCGGDFFLGADVRPYLITEEISHAAELISVANGLSRASRKCTGDGSMDPRFVKAWLKCQDFIPSVYRVWGPPCEGDSWIHTEEERRWDVSEKGGVRYILGVLPILSYRSAERYCELTREVAWLAGASNQQALRGVQDYKLRYICA